MDSPNQIAAPDSAVRAPRVLLGGQSSLARRYAAPAALRGVVIAVLSRDTRGVALSDAQRLSHFPASPFICLSWRHQGESGLVERSESASVWRGFNSDVMISGSQSSSSVAWSPGPAMGGMAYFSVSTARELFNLDASLIQDRSVCARSVLGHTWFAMCDDLASSSDDAAMLAALEKHIAPCWQCLSRQALTMGTLQRAGQRWVEGLAAQANEWSLSRSMRQVERRIKKISGRSLRDWHLLVSTEQVFFTARDQQESGRMLDWAALALDAGFADQAHLNRTVKRLTGFPPAEFARRFIEDESFWVYRLWA